MKSIKGIAQSILRKIETALDPVAAARKAGVRIGDHCRLINVQFGSEPYLVTLGNHVSITNSRFITHDGGVWVFREMEPDLDVFAPINVGNNVFVGSGCTILPGASISDDVVIGAGAVVSRDIPSGVVAVGVPARPVKSLEDYRESLEGKKLPTKSMDHSTKRAFLISHFNQE